jgi:serine/threonine protein kinase
MKPRLISEGTYGCIFNPGFSCNYSSSTNNSGSQQQQQQKNDVKYATKVHSNVNLSIVKNEIAISTKIRENISNFDLYFSPVLETCKVSLAKVDADKCKIIKDKKPTQFISTKMKYVDGVTLYKHVDHLMKRVKMQTKLYAEVAALYKKMCNGLEELRVISVVHFDLKDNNVVVTKTGSPIIIDFGISIDMDKIIGAMSVHKASTSAHALTKASASSPSFKSSEHKQDFYKLLDSSFYAYSTDYLPWCVDIVLISYIVQKQKPKDIITAEQIMSIFDEVMRKNKLSSKIYLKDPLRVYREKFKETIAYKFNETENVLLLYYLLENFGKWDLYAATLLFVEMLDKINQVPNINHIQDIKYGLGFIE